MAKCSEINVLLGRSISIWTQLGPQWWDTNCICTIVEPLLLSRLRCESAMLLKKWVGWVEATFSVNFTPIENRSLSCSTLLGKMIELVELRKVHIGSLGRGCGEVKSLRGVECSKILRGDQGKIFEFSKHPTPTRFDMFYVYAPCSYALFIMGSTRVGMQFVYKWSSYLDFSV